MKLIETGDYHALAIKENGDLCGIGGYGCGELGLGDTTRRSNWTKVSAFDGMEIRQVQCGNIRSAVLTNRGLYVMGFRLFAGQDYVTTPTRIGLEGVINISMRRRFVKYFLTMEIV